MNNICQSMLDINGLIREMKREKASLEVKLMERNHKLNGLYRIMIYFILYLNYCLCLSLQYFISFCFHKLIH